MALFSRLLNLLRKSRVDSEADEELRFHVESRIRDNLAAGMNAEDARRDAIRRVGNQTLAHEKTRETDIVVWVETFVQDAKYGLRTLANNLAFTGVAVFTLALGIGANTSIFSVVRSIVFRPLPYRDPDRLVWIGDTDKKNPAGQVAITQATIRSDIFEEWRRQGGSFESLAAYHAFFSYLSYNLTGRGEPERLPGIEVSQSLFPLLGVEAAIGRVFRPDEDQPGASPVVLLTHGFWQRRFASDPRVVGQTITLNDRPSAIVGVLPASFDFGSVFSPGARLDVFLPLILDKKSRGYGHFLGAVGRLRPGVKIAAAQEQMDAIVREQRGRDRYAVSGVWLVPLRDRVVGGVRSALLVLLGAVVFVLLIACTNLANLLLARGASRRKEMAVRAALGAGRFRLVRQLFTESILLGILGGLVGLGMALFGVPWLSGLSTIPIPRLGGVHVDSWTLTFALIISIFTGVLFGLFPAIQVYRSDINDPLKDATRGSSGNKHRLREALVVFEVALSLVLLVGAGLLIRSFWRLLQVDPGFRPEGVIAARIDPGNKYGRRERLVAFFDDVLRRVAVIPGVDAAAYSDTLPLDRDRIWDLVPSGANLRPDQWPSVFNHVVSPGYFRVMGIPLRQGRMFTERDTASSQGVVVVNQSLAQRLWPNLNAVGQMAETNGKKLQVIGIVGDVRHSGLDKNAGLEMYLALPQFPFSFMDLVVRTRIAPEALAPAIRQAVWSVDGNQPVAHFRTIQQMVDTALSPRRFSMWLLTAFAAAALVLAAVGSYGVMAYSVAQRTHEIGIRLALGASPSSVLRMVVMRGAALAIIGILMGSAGALILTSSLRSQLYEVNLIDPLSFAAVALLLMSAIVLASFLPARRAIQVDPAAALRSE